MAPKPIQHVQSVADVAPITAPVVVDLAPVEHGKFRLSPAGLTVVGEPTYEEWEEVGHVLAVSSHGLPFIVGDWIRLGRERFAELAEQVIDARHWSEATVHNYVWLSEKVPPENRMIAQGLGVRHHQVVATLPPAQQKRWLSAAVGDGSNPPWPVHRLAAAVKEGADEPITGWYILVHCVSETHRAKMVKMLELESATCRLVDKREAKL